MSKTKILIAVMALALLSGYLFFGPDRAWFEANPPIAVAVAAIADPGLAGERMADSGRATEANAADFLAVTPVGRGNPSTSLSRGEVERRLLTGQFLNDEAMRIAASAEFDRYLARIEADATAQTLESTRSYRSLVAALLDGQERIDRIACSARLCLAKIQSDAADLGKDHPWTDLLLDAASGSALPIGAMIEQPLARHDGGTEMRLVFTVMATPGGFVVR